MREGASIINLKFTFARDRIEALKMFPEGTDAVAVFNYYSSAQQTVDTLCELGTSNLNLYIDYPGNMNFVQLCCFNQMAGAEGFELSTRNFQLLFSWLFFQT